MRRQAVLAVGRHGGAHDVAGGDAPALAGQLVAAARAAHAFQDAVPHERLQDRSRDGAAAGCAAPPGALAATGVGRA